MTKMQRWLSGVLITAMVCTGVTYSAPLIQHWQIEPYYLNDLADVNAPAPSNNDSLTWDSVSGYWIPEAVSSSFTLAGSTGTQTISAGDTLTVAAGTGILTTPVTATDTVTINTVWKRTGTQIEPQTADDYLKVQIGTPVGAAPADGAVRVHAATGNGINCITEDNAASAAIWGQTLGIAGIGVVGYSAQYHGVYGNTLGGNSFYGIYGVGGIYSDSYYDVDDEASVANPPANSIRFWAVSDGMAYTQTSGGIIACLTSQGKETHAVSIGSDVACAVPAHTDALGVNTFSAKTPESSVISDDIAYHSFCTFQAPAATGDVIAMTESYGRFSWTGKRAAPVTYKQSYVVFGSPFELFSGNAGSTKCKAARAYCRVRCNETDYLYDVILTISEAAGTNSAHAHLKASMTDNTWYEGETAISDISAWTGPLRVTAVAYGVALVNGNTFATTFDCEWLACEQYAN